MLVVLLREVNHGVWSHLEFAGRNATTLSHEGINVEELIKNRCHVRLKVAPFRNQMHIKSHPYAHCYALRVLKFTFFDEHPSIPGSTFSCRLPGRQYCMDFKELACQCSSKAKRTKKYIRLQKWPCN